MRELEIKKVKTVEMVYKQVHIHGRGFQELQSSSKNKIYTTLRNGYLISLFVTRAISSLTIVANRNFQPFQFREYGIDNFCAPTVLPCTISCGRPSEMLPTTTSESTAEIVQAIQSSKITERNSLYSK